MFKELLFIEQLVITMYLKVALCWFLVFFSSIQAFAQAGVEKTFGSPLSTELRVKSNSTGLVLSSLSRLQFAQYDECGNSLFALQFRRQTNPAAIFEARDFIQLSNGDFAYLIAAASGNLFKSVVVRITNSGTIVWSNEIYNPNADVQFNDFSLMEDSQGDLLVFGTVPQTLFGNTFPRLTKIDATNGTVLWTRSYLISQPFGKAIITSDDGVLIRLGSTLLKTDSNGNRLWTVNAVGLSDNSNEVLELSDGYIITNSNQNTDFIEILKFDFQGNPIARKAIRLVASAFDLVKSGSNSFIVGLFRTNTPFSTPADLIEFTDNLDFIRNTRTSLPLIGTDLEFNSKQEAIVVGKPTGINGGLVHFNSDFSTSCNAGGVSPSFLDLSFTTNSLSIGQSNLTLNSRAFPLIVTSFNLSETVLCSASPPSISLGPDRSFCANSTELSNTLGGHFDNYLWSTGETTPTIKPNQTGTYWLQASSSCSGQTASDTIEVSVFPSIEINLGSFATICGNQITELVGPECTNCSYLWSNGSQNRSTNIFEVGTYWLEVENQNGCTSSDTIDVNFGFCDCKTYIPSAFSPNNDGINDTYSLSVACETNSFQFLIIDRWGRVIFKTDNQNFSWDGTLNGENCTIGFYSYRLEFAPISSDGSEQIQVKQGQLQLLR